MIITTNLSPVAGGSFGPVSFMGVPDGSACYGSHTDTVGGAVMRACRVEFVNRCYLQESGLRPLLRGVFSVVNNDTNKIFFPNEHKKLVEMGF